MATDDRVARAVTSAAQLPRHLLSIAIFFGIAQSAIG